MPRIGVYRTIKNFGDLFIDGVGFFRCQLVPENPDGSDDLRSVDYVTFISAEGTILNLLFDINCSRFITSLNDGRWIYNASRYSYKKSRH